MTKAEVPVERSTLPQGSAWMLFAGFAFGWVVVYSRGAYSEPALVFVLMAFFALMIRWSTQLRREEQAEGSTALAPLIWLTAFAFAFFSWNDIEAIIYPMAPFKTGRLGQALLLIGLLTYLPFLTGRWNEHRFLRLGRFIALAGALAVAGQGVITSSPTPYIDVWTVQQGGADALAHGHNPYTAVAVRDTGPREGVDVPYVYPPTQVLLTLPAYVLGKDVRYTMLAALLLTGFALRFIVRRSGRALPAIVEDGPALVLWTMPKMLFILEQAWVDPVQLMLLCAAAASVLTKRPILIAVAFGVVLTAKQTMFWAVGLGGVFLRFTKKQWLIVAAVGGLVVLPFAIADFVRLKHSLFDFVNALPDRPDALTFNNWVFRKYAVMVPTSLAFPFAGLVAIVSALKMPRTLQHWALATAATYTVFFVFNKWAFANYYFTLGGLAALAAACATHPAGPAGAGPSPELK